MLELHDFTVKAGCRPIAAGAFIGEHSFSSTTLPIAPGRPDEPDIKEAEKFGKHIREKVKQLISINDITPLRFPGKSPYKKQGKHSWKPPGTRQQLCTLCGNCKSGCPAGAITISDKIKTDRHSCIYCCACIKNCPEGARFIADIKMKGLAVLLHKGFSARKDPQWFI